MVTAGPITAGLWSSAGGPCIYLLRGHEGKLLTVAFSPGSERIATGGEDGTVRVWRCTICGTAKDTRSLSPSARLARTGRVRDGRGAARYGL